jgi:hypothetical protein
MLSILNAIDLMNFYNYKMHKICASSERVVKSAVQAARAGVARPMDEQRKEDVHGST